MLIKLVNVAKIKIGFFYWWIPIYIIGITVAIFKIDSVFFMITTQSYFLIFAFFNIKYAYISKSTPEKKNHTEYFKNELLVGILFIALTIYYPFIFHKVENRALIPQFYFHIWDSLTIHLLCWKIYLFFAKRNNIKHNRLMSYKDWKEKIYFIHRNSSETKSDFKRKLMHFITPATVIFLYLLNFFANSFLKTIGLDDNSLIIYSWVVLGIHALWVMNISDLLRLNKFNTLGKFATRWFENSLRPKELDTYASATIMFLSWLPFILTGVPLFLSVVLIGTISDALASLIGKKFGRIKFKKSDKTIAGFIAGFVSTYLIVIFVGFFVSFANISALELLIIAFGAAIGFVLVDIFTKDISDNFLNPIFVGIIIFILKSFFFSY